MLTDGDISKYGEQQLVREPGSAAQRVIGVAGTAPTNFNPI